MLEAPPGFEPGMEVFASAVHRAIAGWRSNIGGQFMIGVLQVFGGKQRTLLAVSDGFPAEREVLVRRTVARISKRWQRI